MVATSRIVKCTTLRQACLTVNEPQPSCSGTCRKRPFRLDVYGDSAAADVAAVMRERQLKRYPMGRFGEPNDAAAATLYLASREADWVTGQTLPVNGGYRTS